MKRTITLTLAILLAATAALADISGAWTATESDKKPGKMYFSMNRGRHHQNGSTYDTSAFTGLSAAQINAPSSTPVQFELRREAGTVAFEGTFKKGNGAGQFSFTPNRNYETAIRALGVDLDLHHEEKSEDLFVLALHDVSTDFIRSMQAAGYKVTLEKYMAFRIFNVTPEYVREMASLGYDKLSADRLVETKIHKVTPDYIREMRASGKNLSLDDLVQSRIFKVTPEFAAEMARLGYRDLDHDKLVAFKIHKVTPEFIRDLRALGYDNISADRLVEMRIHRVTPEFIRQLAAAGYRNVPVSKLINMRIHRIEPDMVKKLNDAAKD